jgi:hypothetical protein
MVVSKELKSRGWFSKFQNSTQNKAEKSGQCHASACNLNVNFLSSSCKENHFLKFYTTFAHAIIKTPLMMGTIFTDSEPIPQYN